MTVITKRKILKVDYKIVKYTLLYSRKHPQAYKLCDILAAYSEPELALLGNRFD